MPLIMKPFQAMIMFLVVAVVVVVVVVVVVAMSPWLKPRRHTDR